MGIEMDRQTLIERRTLPSFVRMRRPSATLQKVTNSPRRIVARPAGPDLSGEESAETCQSSILDKSRAISRLIQQGEVADPTGLTRVPNPSTGVFGLYRICGGGTGSVSRFRHNWRRKFV